MRTRPRYVLERLTEFFNVPSNTTHNLSYVKFSGATLQTKWLKELKLMLCLSSLAVKYEKSNTHPRTPRRPRNQLQNSCRSTQSSQSIPFSRRPVHNLPRLDIIVNDEAQTLNGPFGVHRPRCLSSPTMVWTNTSNRSILLAAPDTSCQISTVIVWAAEDVPRRCQSRL